MHGLAIRHQYPEPFGSLVLFLSTTKWLTFLQRSSTTKHVVRRATGSRKHPCGMLRRSYRCLNSVPNIAYRGCRSLSHPTKSTVSPASKSVHIYGRLCVVEPNEQHPLNLPSIITILQPPRWAGPTAVPGCIQWAAAHLSASREVGRAIYSAVS